MGGLVTKLEISLSVYAQFSKVIAHLSLRSNFFKKICIGMMMTSFHLCFLNLA